VEAWRRRGRGRGRGRGEEEEERGGRWGRTRMELARRWSLECLAFDSSNQVRAGRAKSSPYHLPYFAPSLPVSNRK
jgi:hypothetical protein